MDFHTEDGVWTTPARMTEWLHRTVPLSAAMKARVLQLGEGVATLTMPLGPNVNHMGTAFGGSLNALGLLTAAAVLTRLRPAGHKHQIVVRHSEYDYHSPATSAPTAQAKLTDPQWAQIQPALEAGAPARLQIEATITTPTHPTGTLKAHFTLLPNPTSRG